MLLDNECDELIHWFDKTFQRGKINIHRGRNSKDNSEEYRITFSVNGKNFQAELRVPSGGEDAQNKDFVTMFRTKFVELQKAKITKAMQQYG